MALHLIHGPAGSGKSAYLYREIAKRHLETGTPFCLVVPHLDDAREVEKRLTALTPRGGLFSGQNVITFDALLLALLKFNLPRLHRATESLIRLALRKLLAEKKYPTLTPLQEYPGFILRLAKTILAVKKSGLKAGALDYYVRKFESAEWQDLKNLLSDYDALLAGITHFDDGDLVAKTLELAGSAKLQLPPDWQALYFDRLFPLTIGEREILAALVRIKPDLPVTLAYSFDYQAGDDPYFYPAYSLLGEIAGTQEYFNRTTTGPVATLTRLNEPVSEIRWITSKIGEFRAKGIPLDAMAVVIPDDYYHWRLAEELARLNLPFYPEAPASITDYFEKPPQDSTLISLFQNERRLKNVLLAEQCLHEFDQRWQFETGLLFDKPATSNQRHRRVEGEAPAALPMEGATLAPLTEWRHEEWRLLQLPVQKTPRGIKLLPVSHVCTADHRIVFIPSYTHSRYGAQSQEPAFFLPEMASDPVFRELLESPAYKIRKLTLGLEQIFWRTSEQVLLSYPSLHLNGQEQEPARLLPLDLAEEHRRLATTPAPAKPQPRFGNRHLAQLSLSEIEAYLSCPFRYYARYHLKLGELPGDGEDIDPKTRGLLVHRVLQRLLTEHERIYSEAVEYDVYIKQLDEIASALVDEEAKLSVVLAQSLPAVRDSFLTRLKASLSQMLTEEITALRDHRKKTKPSYFEWAFGKGQVPPLRLRHDGQDVFITGRIDRIDVNTLEKSFSVIDYKTGSADTAVKKGDTPQIPLYLMAVENLLLKGFRPSAGILMGLADLTRKGIVLEGSVDESFLGKHYRITDEEWEELKKKTTGLIVAAAQGIGAGAFSPQPREGLKTCRHCDYRFICHFKAGAETEEDS